MIVDEVTPLFTHTSPPKTLLEWTEIDQID